MKSPKKKKTPAKPSKGAAKQPGEHLFLHRIILVVIAFIAGAAIMIIELAAIRVLAPWFGNSLYTWTGLIGVILIAMSFGYYAGGWLADKKTSYSFLSHILTVAALFILAIPLFSNFIGTPLAKYNVILGPVVASLLMFALPGCLLGSVSPYTVRLVSLLSADKHIGVSAGTIAMVSTFGSVLGTFAAGFWLIPSLNLENVFWYTGIAVAILACLGYFLSFQQRGRIAVHVLVLVAAIPLLLLAAALTKPPRDANILFEKTSYYHRIRVIKSDLPSGDRKTELFLDTTLEGAHYDKSPEIPIPYQRYWELARVFCKKVNTALFLGGGAFKMPQSFLDTYPQARVEVVEIDPAVVEVGRLFFRVNKYPRMHITVDDARRYLAHSKQKYDFIYGDVYNGVRSVPAHLLTMEFFLAVKQHLNEHGIFMMNLISAIKGKDASLFLSVSNTINQVFPRTYVFALNPQKLNSAQNIILVAANFDLNMDTVLSALPPERQYLGKMLRTLVPPREYRAQEGYLLTDRFNPVEYLVARMLRN